MNTGDNKSVIITHPKIIHFDLPRNVGKNFKYEINSRIKYNDFLAKHTVENKISQLLSKHNHGSNQLGKK